MKKKLSRVWGMLKGRTSTEKLDTMQSPATKDQAVRRAAAADRVAESELLLAQVHQRGPRVMAHANEIRTLRTENGFAALVLDAFRGTT